MKKSLYIFFILISLFSFAQSGPNPFEDRESETAFNRDVAVKENEIKDNPQADPGGGNPNDPVPIDNYIPFLLIAALGLIIYQVRKENQVS